MAIMKPAHSKATPVKAIAYILDKEKMEVWGCLELDASRGPDARYLADQMQETMEMHGKGKDIKERKYYHYKISFALEDRSENGGSMTTEKSDEFAREYAEKHWPGREVVWAVQGDGNARHIHFIVAATDLQTGEALQVSPKTWVQWKDDCQDLCVAYGATPMDWREATRQKRAGKERQPQEPVTECFAEKGLKERGEPVWKGHIREVVDWAAAYACDMDEFKEMLDEYGIKITRCTENSISYKLGDHKAVRGDKLGGDYTADAIRCALQHNHESVLVDAIPQKLPAGQRFSFDDIYSRADRKSEAAALQNRVIPEDERQMYRELGRLGGVKRAVIDDICDHAEVATWTEKQAVWDDYRAANDTFWEQYSVRSKGLDKELDAAYARLRSEREFEWFLLHQRSLFLMLISLVIYMMIPNRVAEAERQVQELKKKRQDLWDEKKAYKASSGEAREVLRQKGLSLDEYTDAIKQMQNFADKMYLANVQLYSPEQRATLEMEVEHDRMKREQQMEKKLKKNNGAPSGGGGDR